MTAARPSNPIKKDRKDPMERDMIMGTNISREKTMSDATLAGPDMLNLEVSSFHPASARARLTASRQAKKSGEKVSPKTLFNLTCSNSPSAGSPHRLTLRSRPPKYCSSPKRLWTMAARKINPDRGRKISAGIYFKRGQEQEQAGQEDDEFPRALQRI